MYKFCADRRRDCETLLIDLCSSIGSTLGLWGLGPPPPAETAEMMHKGKGGKGKKGKGKGKGKGGYGAWYKPRSGKGKGYSPY